MHVHDSLAAARRAHLLMMAAKAYMAMTAFLLKAMSTAVNGGNLFYRSARPAGAPFLWRRDPF